MSGKGWYLGAVVALLLLGTAVIRAEPATAPLKVGFGGAADPHRTLPMWRQYGLYREFQDRGMLADYLRIGDWYSGQASEEAIYQTLVQYHVFIIEVPRCFIKLDYEATTRNLQRALDRYLRAGGGLYIMIDNPEYRQDRKIDVFNLVFGHYGVRMLDEGICDLTREYQYLGHPSLSHREPVAPSYFRFFHTAHITPSPLTEGVRNLYLPQWGNGGMWGTFAAAYSPEWEVVVRGEKEAKSYVDDTPGSTKNGLYRKVGTYAEAPPIAAWRDWEGGRLAAYSCAAMHLTLNSRHTEDYPGIHEYAGDSERQIPSDGYQLFFNTIRHLGETGQRNPALGGYVEQPLPSYEPPAAISMERQRFPVVVARQSQGVIGLHSALSDGSGTVAEYCRAAKAAGLDFVVFSEALEKLTAAEFAELRAACQRESSADFYACPGLEFTDSMGLRWVFWGENVRYPEASMLDGEGRVFYWGNYAAYCDRNPSMCINFEHLRTLGKAQFCWWYFRTPVAVYRRGALAEETFSEYLLALSDIRGMAPVIYSGIYAPERLAAEAAESGVNRVYGGLDQARLYLSSKNIYNSALGYTSSGPVISQWAALNMHPRYWAGLTAGSQRVRCRFAVSAAAGLAQIKVHDGARGVIRSFAGGGVPELALEFELVNHKQQFLVLEVIDSQGKRAISQALVIKHPFYDISRCTDNLNLLGPSTLLQFPPQHGYITASRSFEDLGGRRGSGPEQMPFAGIDTASAFTFDPQASFAVAVSTLQGEQPAGTNANDDHSSHEIDYVFSSYGLSHIAALSTMRTDTHKRHRPDQRVSYAAAAFFAQTHPQPLADLHYDSYLLRSRIRPELKNVLPARAARDYRGGVMIHTARLTFKKDVELKGPMPIEAAGVDPGPIYYRAENGYCDRIVAKTAVGLLDTPVSAQSGVLAQGGYVTVLSRASSRRVVLLGAADRAEPVFQVDARGRVVLGFGQAGQRFKAGDVLELRLVIGTLTGEPDDVAALERFAACFPLAGTSDGIETWEAVGHAVQIKVDAGLWVCDKPFRVINLQDNGCAAYYERHGGRRFIFAPVSGGRMYFQSAVDQGGDIWAGNVFVASDPALRLTLVADGQEPGAQPWLEVHNPGSAAVSATISSPAGTPVFGGMSWAVEIPAGTSQRQPLAPAAP